MSLFGLRLKQPWVFVFLLLFGVMAVTSSYTRLSETDDELFHISCGAQWLRDGLYTIQPLHPPIARVMDALLPTLYNTFVEPINFAKRDGYILNMVLSRLGSLPFYFFSCFLVFVWARRLFGEVAGLWSLGLYVSLSTVTAHAMLATTDIGYTAMFLWALYMTVLWLEDASMRRSFWLGISLALMVGTKYSGLVHWPASFVVIVLASMFGRWRRGEGILPFTQLHIFHGFVVVLPAFMFVLWLVFRCDFTPLVLGIRSVFALEKIGFGVWFYGPVTHEGSWQFFPVVFFYKTSLSFFAAIIAGLVLSKRSVNMEICLFPFLAAVAVLLSSMPSDINLGVRHVLPMYPLLSIFAGYGMLRLWHTRILGRLGAAILVVCHVISFCMTHPEHIAYFNFLAGEHPEKITLDSDFDWGQSVLFLDDALVQRKVRDFYLCVRKDAVRSAQFVVSARKLGCPQKRIVGWLAISRAWRLQNPYYFSWLSEDMKVEKIGKTMDLYYVPRIDVTAESNVLKNKGKKPKPERFITESFVRSLVPALGASRVPSRKPPLTFSRP